MKSSKIILNILSAVCFIYGALYIFTLVFIPIGIYCFIAGRRFSYKAEHLFDELMFSNEVFRNYVIFCSIFCFPLGLLSIIPYLILTGNNVKIKTAKENYFQSSAQQADNFSSNDNITITDSLNSENSAASGQNQGDDSTESLGGESYDEKLKKFKKLENFKEKGLITEEELEQAREQLFGKNEENN